MLKNYKLIAMTLLLTSSLAGCVTVEDFLENLGLKRSDKVQTVYVNPIRATYEIVSTANVRAAPSLNADIVGTLGAGQRFLAVGTTGEWFAIGDRDGYVLGYVHGSLVKEVGTKKRTRKAKAEPASSSGATKVETKSDSMNLDDIPEQKSPSSSSTPSASSTKPTKTESVNLDDL